MTKKKSLSAILLRAMALGGLSLILASVSSAETHTWVGVGPVETPSNGDGANLFGPGLDGDIYVNNWSAPLVVGNSLAALDFVIGASELTDATNLFLGASQSINSLAFTGNYTTGVKIYGSGDLATTNTLTFSNAGSTILSLTGNTGSSILTFDSTARIALNYTGLGIIDIATGATFNANSVISGTGGIQKTGGGTMVLGAVNSITGDISILGGKISTVGFSRMGTGTNVVLNGGTLSFTYVSSPLDSAAITSKTFQVGANVGTIEVLNGTGSSTRTINGVISNVAGEAGVLRKTGAGTLVLGATNTFSGGLEILEGTVSVSSTLRLGADTGGTIIDGGTLAITSTVFSTGTRKYYVGDSVGTFAISGTNVRILGQILDRTGEVGIFRKTGNGALSIQGDNSFTGGTQLNAGTLRMVGASAILGGSTSVTGISIASGATLVGSGTVNGNSTVQAGGILSAGTYSSGSDSALTSAFGTLMFNGNLDLTGAATTASLYFDLGTTTGSDKLIVSSQLLIGTGLLGLSDFVFTGDSTTFGAGTYTLITSGSVVGSLLNGDITGVVGGRDATLAIDGNNVVLIVGAVSAVPEPATWAAIFGAAALSIAVIRRRKASAV